jgi:hypothetical protein
MASRRVLTSADVLVTRWAHLSRSQQIEPMCQHTHLTEYWPRMRCSREPRPQDCQRIRCPSNRDPINPIDTAPQEGEASRLPLGTVRQEGETSGLPIGYVALGRESLRIASGYGASSRGSLMIALDTVPGKGKPQDCKWMRCPRKERSQHCHWIRCPRKGKPLDCHWIRRPRKGRPQQCLWKRCARGGGAS